MIDSRPITGEMVEKAENMIKLLSDPVKFVQLCWPDVKLYDKQVEIMYSVRDNDETIVPAGNQLGKDFISGLIVLWFFCSRSPCRIVTSSAGQTQLKSVLWGEMRRFINSSKYPLPIQVNDMLIRQVMPNGELEPRSYIQGIVTNVEENLLGHHLEKTIAIEDDQIAAMLRHGLIDGSNIRPRTMCVFDEASSIETKFYDASDTWAHRKLIIGNPLPCVNFFYSHVKAGDVKSQDGKRFYRKIIKIKAAQSPNVILAERQIAVGKQPTGEILIPGVVDYPLYQKRRQLWDPVRQCIGLDAEFYEGASVLLYPPDWLNKAEEYARDMDRIIPRRNRRGRAIGIDSAEGGDNTVWTVVDEFGIILQRSVRTHDTSDIPGDTIALGKEWGVEPEQWLFDMGGGGKQHADALRKMGYNVRLIGFGESATGKQYKRRTSKTKKMEDNEQRYMYKNRRAEMYGIVRYELLNPALIDEDYKGFGIPADLNELRRQMAPLPLLFDGEGRMYLPPKNKPTKEYKGITIKELVGCSPDEADSLVLACYGMMNPSDTGKFRIQ